MPIDRKDPLKLSWLRNIWLEHFGEGDVWCYRENSKNDILTSQTHKILKEGTHHDTTVEYMNTSDNIYFKDHPEKRKEIHYIVYGTHPILGKWMHVDETNNIKENSWALLYIQNQPSVIHPFFNGQFFLFDGIESQTEEANELWRQEKAKGAQPGTPWIPGKSD